MCDYFVYPKSLNHIEHEPLVQRIELLEECTELYDSVRYISSRYVLWFLLSLWTKYIRIMFNTKKCSFPLTIAANVVQGSSSYSATDCLLLQSRFLSTASRSLTSCGLESAWTCLLESFSLLVFFVRILHFPVLYNLIYNRLATFS